MESPFNILLIGNDARTSELVRTWLADERYALQIVDLQRYAVERTEVQYVDLIIVDADVPDLDLLELSSYAKDHPPCAKGGRLGGVSPPGMKARL